MAQQDLMDGCNEHAVPVSEFESLFCVRCRQPACVRAGWAKDRFAQRTATQLERLSNPLIANLENPRYAQFRELDFPSLLDKAVRLSIADQKNDWNIPEKAVLKTETSPLADAPNSDLALSPLEPEISSDVEPLRPIGPAHMPARNVASNPDGILLDGPVPKQEPLADPWAAPKPKSLIVAVGSRVRLGTEG